MHVILWIAGMRISCGPSFQFYDHELLEMFSCETGFEIVWMWEMLGWVWESLDARNAWIGQNAWMWEVLEYTSSLSLTAHSWKLWTWFIKELIWASHRKVDNSCMEIIRSLRLQTRCTSVAPNTVVTTLESSCRDALMSTLSVHNRRSRVGPKLHPIL